ncbi:hypothetical protein M3Y94_00846100 [Aphelenchoides besseyi]|nr:hypothetical protein M3Y94_00846100 [Aphelenchoides besseyi]
MNEMSNGVQTTNVRVIAKFNFEGRNNDELTFSKNDVITVTQQLDGGWWEGSLGEQIGWFPSSFVGVIKTQNEDRENGQSTVGLSEIDGVDFEAKKLKFRNEILSGVDGFLTKECDHISVLVRLTTEFLSLIAEKKKIPNGEFNVLASSIVEIVDIKKSLLQQLQNTLTKEIGEQKVGGIFLDQAPIFKKFLFAYCENHPNIVALINKYRAGLENALRSEKLAIKDLITGLSLVFRHTEKYSTVLQEVERNTPVLNSDRGNLQRAAAVYRDIAEECALLRKQKELQLEFLSSNVLEKTLNKNANQQLGDLVYISSVTVKLPDTNDDDPLLDRYFVLFINSCLFYEISLQDAAYILKENIPTATVTCVKDEAAMRTTLLKGKKPILTINSLTAFDYRTLNSALDRCSFVEIRNEDYSNAQSLSPILPNEIQRTGSMSPVKHVDVSQLPQPMKPQFHRNNSVSTNGNIRLNHDVEMILPDGLNETRAQKPPPGPNSNSTTRISRNAKLYSGWCLRPYPPPRGSVCLQTSTSSSSIKMRKGLTIEEQDDAHLLKIVEGYCGPPATGGLSNSFSRMQMSTMSNYPQTRRASYPEEMRPQLIMADDEKIFVEEIEGNEVVIKEKSLVDTVYALKDQVTSLQQEIANMTKTVDKEQKARRRLEDVVRRLSANHSHSSTPRPDQPDSGSI